MMLQPKLISTASDEVRESFSAWRTLQPPDLQSLALMALKFIHKYLRCPKKNRQQLNRRTALTQHMHLHEYDYTTSWKTMTLRPNLIWTASDEVMESFSALQPPDFAVSSVNDVKVHMQTPEMSKAESPAIKSKNYTYSTHAFTLG